MMAKPKKYNVRINKGKAPVKKPKKRTVRMNKDASDLEYYSPYSSDKQPVILNPYNQTMAWAHRLNQAFTPGHPMTYTTLDRLREGLIPRTTTDIGQPPGPVHTTTITEKPKKNNDGGNSMIHKSYWKRYYHKKRYYNRY